MFVFNGRNLELEIKYYPNKRVCLLLNEKDTNTGFFVPYNKLTINLPGITLAENEVIINFNANNAENELERENLEIIFSLKIASPVIPYRFVNSGFKTYPVFKLKRDNINKFMKGGYLYE